MSDSLAPGVQALVEAMRRLGAGEAGVRCRVIDLPADLEELARAFDDMAERVDVRYSETEHLAASLRALTGRVESLQEEERSAIAIEIHDQIGQALTALKLDLAWLQRKIAVGPTEETLLLRQRISEMMDLVDATADRVHNLAMELRPDVLDRLGLPEAIEWQARQFEQRTGIETRFETNITEPLEPQRSTAMFRIVQEALMNVARHAGAHSVRVKLTAAGQHAIVEIADDGRGLGTERAPGVARLGLLGMRERALAFGGDVVIGAAPGHGTVITVRIPLE